MTRFISDGKDQESTSEAVNAYYAVYLLGLAIGNDEMRDFGRVLLATEMRSVRTYWHMSHNSSVYPANFSKNAVVGILWSDKADYATWFGRTRLISLVPLLPG